MMLGGRRQSGRFIKKRISNYEGFKALDKLQEKIAEGKLKPPREPVRDHLCEVCKTRKRSVRVVPCLTMGRKLTGTPLKGLFVLACDECARSLERAGVPQAAAEQTKRMAALGLVLP
jgi:hypothetical protein